MPVSCIVNTITPQCFDNYVLLDMAFGSSAFVLKSLSSCNSELGHHSILELPRGNTRLYD